MGEADSFALELPPTLIEALAERAAEIVAEQNAGYLDVKGAAQFLGGCSPKRIYNLVERGELPHYRLPAGFCSIGASSASGWRVR